MSMVSDEAKRLDDVMSRSAVAFSYFDPADRLALWNEAYRELNFRIQGLIRKGALFRDLLAELVKHGQIAIQGDPKAWIDARLRARQLGRTAFRHLTDGRVFVVQERKDEIGGTLGFWIDVSDLFRHGALHGDPTWAAEARSAPDSPGYQDLMRNQLQTIISNLELLRRELAPEMHTFVADALLAAETIRACLTILRDGDD